MNESIGRYLSGLCVILLGALVLIILFQVTTSNAYGASANFTMVSQGDSPNIVTDGMAGAASQLDSETSIANKVITDDVKSVADVSVQSVKFVGSAMQTGATTAARTVVNGVTLVTRGTTDSVVFIGRGIGSGFAFAGLASINTVNTLASATHVKSLIQPSNNAAVPTIKQLRIQQAALIQSGTENVSITPVADGQGGACDIGQGNGGYPMRWCDAPMDSIDTILYSGDPINRECTSYAYWYFTSIEGHASLHVEGNAKYWAATANFPTSSIPRVGAIAVETVGAYGHVAIVQALAGQTYAGQMVPAGYVLVSEMNYDWGGHFRYSFSPLNKFSAYIYPRS